MSKLREAAQAALKILEDAQTVDLLDAESRAQVDELRAALSEPEGGLYLTIVYKDVQPGPECTELCRHPKVSAVSWSHAIDDRNAARAALKEKNA